MAIFITLLMAAAAGHPAARSIEAHTSARIGVGAQVLDCALVTRSGSGVRAGTRGCDGAPVVGRAQMCRDEAAPSCAMPVQTGSDRRGGATALDIHYF